VTGRLGRIGRGIGNRARRARLARARRRRPPPPPVVPWTLAVDGPPWLAELLAGTVRVVAVDAVPDAVVATHTDRPGGDAAVPFRTGAPTSIGERAVVDVRRANPVHRSWPAGLPADLERAARAASRVVEPRPGTAPWLAATAERHGAMREAQSATVVDVVADLARATGRPGPAPRDETVTIVCVTNRPAELARLAANVATQRHPHRRLIIVLNNDAFDVGAVEARLGDVADDVRILRRPEHETLGACLNAALDAVATRFVAKFDDDDHYGPDFLGDLLLAHRYADAAVVGKHSHYAYLAAADRTVLRAPGREFEYTSHVAGGTLVVDLARAEGIRFPDRSVGEDGAFLAACEQRGEAVFAADRFNYLQVRHGSNTWVVGDRAFRRGAVDVGTGRCLDAILR